MAGRISWAQADICADPVAALKVASSAAESSDIVELANQGFVFFKVQLARMPWHRSGMGRHAYVFPLERTQLLSLGHFYLVDPVALHQLELPVESFRGSHLYGQLEAATKLAQGLLRRLDTNDGAGHVLFYPATGERHDLDATQWLHYGTDGLEGIALTLLREACRMHRCLGDFLVSVAGGEAEMEKMEGEGDSHIRKMRRTREQNNVETMHLLDILLTRGLRVQGLLPGGIATDGITFVQDIGRAS